MIRQVAIVARRFPAVLRSAVAVVLPTVLISAPLVAAAVADDPTAGRLGGTYASFIDRFGEATEQIEGLGLVFAVPDTRYVAVQFNSKETQYGLDDPALLISISADRAESRPTDDLDPNDWTWDTAQAIAADLAPDDALFSAVDDSVPGTRSTTCASDALLDAFGAVSLGECRATYLMSSEDTVSYLTLTLTSGAEAGAGAATPELGCTGVVEWAEGSAARLRDAQRLLDGLSSLSDDPAVAVPDLRALAADLEALAEEQRSADAPREIATANYYIIGGLNDFAAAVELAADGLELGDQTVVDEAVDDLDAADARAARASTEIEAAVAGCNLTVATPESGG